MIVKIGEVTVERNICWQWAGESSGQEKELKVKWLEQKVLK